MNEATITVPRASKEIKLTAADEAKFWGMVDKNGPTQSHMTTPCWIWTAGKLRSGYGTFGAKHSERVRARTLLTHRVSWTLANGQIPHDSNSYGFLVCHHCDVPSCCNPTHLFLGTNTDNARDKEIKGRGNQPRGDRHYARLYPERMPRKGEKNGCSKLTNADVIEIRALYAAGGTTLKILGIRFGVDQTSISNIILRKNWKHLP